MVTTMIIPMLHTGVGDVDGDPFLKVFELEIPWDCTFSYCGLQEDLEVPSSSPSSPSSYHHHHHDHVHDDGDDDDDDDHDKDDDNDDDDENDDYDEVFRVVVVWTSVWGFRYRVV